MFTQAVEDTKRAYGEIWFDIVIILTSLVFTQILKPLNIFGLSSYFTDDTSRTAAYVLMLALLSIPLVFLNNYLARIRERENPHLLELAYYRTSGVDLRNRLDRATSQEEVESLIKEYQEWDESMLLVLGKISKGKSAWLKTLDKLPWAFLPHGLNSEHIKHVNVLNEKLVRLNSILMSELKL